MKKENLLPSGITQEQVTEWKKEFGGVSLLSITDKEDSSKKYACIVKNPLPKKAIEMALKWIDKDMYKLCDVLLKNSWLAGDEIIKERAEYVLTAGGKLSEKLDAAESEIINL